jgi:tRNA 2-thiouridine synthesizing protein C
MADQKKKFLYINRKAPYGTIYALESLEVVLIGAAFEQEVALAFLDDGVFQLLEEQDTARQQIVADLQVAAEVPIVYEDENEDYAEKPSIHLVDRAEMARIIGESDVVLSF